jgi:hypothetical protein
MLRNIIKERKRKRGLRRLRFPFVRVWWFSEIQTEKERKRDRDRERKRESEGERERKEKSERENKREI